MLDIDYVGLYKVVVDLQNSANDLDVLMEMSDNLPAIEAIANKDLKDSFDHIVDDTTMVYVSKMIVSAKKLVNVFQPLCEDFLGISKDARTDGTVALSDFLVSAGIVLYKRYGYDVISEYYAMNNELDPSKMNLSKEMFDAVTSDLTNVVDTLRTIFTVFNTFGAYFAEYEIADSEDLNDVMANLEDRGYGSEAITMLKPEDVKAILAKEAGN